MDQRVFDRFRALIYQKSGITLHSGKETLVEARVSKRIRELELRDIKDYLNYLENEDDANEIVLMLDAVSTNVTHFFREEKHFEILEQLLLKWSKAGQNKFRIWSSASSTGEEPYTISMVASSCLNIDRMDFKILGTDISTRVLNKAMQAEYPLASLENIPKKYRHYFSTIKEGGEPSQIKVDDKIRQLVSYARLNLSAPPFPMKGPFDVVFCRNVMIYFDNKVRERLVQEIEKLLKPGGYFFIGHSESLMGLQTGFKTVQASVYQKPELT